MGVAWGAVDLVGGAGGWVGREEGRGMGKKKRSREQEQEQQVVAVVRERLRAEQEARMLRQWRQSIDALQQIDDERWRFMRTAAIATETGTARSSTVHHAISPALAAFLDRGPRDQGRAAQEPVHLADRTCMQLLGDALRQPAALTAARVRLALEQPDLSLVFELKGAQGLYSENDIARAMAAPGRAGWSQQSVSLRKHDACRVLRAWVQHPGPVATTDQAPRQEQAG